MADYSELGEIYKDLRGRYPISMRSQLLPFGKDTMGQAVFAIPQAVKDVIESVNMPSRAMRGEYISPQEATKFAMDVAFMGGASGLKAAPSGSLAMGGSKRDIMDFSAEDIQALLDATKDMRPKNIDSNAVEYANKIRQARPDEMKRAVNQGFDVNEVAYRGLGREYDKKKALEQNYQMFTGSGKQAGEYADSPMGGNVIPVFIRKGKNLTIDAKERNFNVLPVGGLPDDVAALLPKDYPVSMDGLAHAAKAAGYDSVTVKNVYDNAWGERTGKPTTINTVFDPKNIRSVNAEFDPAKANSTDLLAANPMPLTAFGLMQKREQYKGKAKGKYGKDFI